MDGNAQNMFHGNHQGEPYYRYDPAAAAAAAAPRAMGPPGGYPPRHRPPHPLQQQSQYPSYQPPTENLYTMGADQHTGMGMGDLTGWGGGPTPGQAGAYPGGGLGAYGHPQAGPTPQQRQTQAQPGYRQHIGAYAQQDQQKISYSAQQNLMGGLMQQPGGYVGLNQQQTQQQRIPQHYPQAANHPMYPGAPQAQPTASAQSYSPYAAAGMQHQPSRSAQHVGYGHGLDQSSYSQHVPTSAAAPGGHQLPGGHSALVSQNHLPPSVSQTQPPPGLHATQQQQQQQSQQTAQQPQQQQQQQAQSAAALASQHLHGQTPQSHAALMHANATPGGLPHGMVSAYNHLQSQQQQQTQQNQQQQQQQQQQPSPYITSAKHQANAAQLSSSPQYRAPFPQLSPQMSPRPQMSPHPQMSPRPVMSPAKPPQQQQPTPITTQSQQHLGMANIAASPRPVIHQQQQQPQNPPTAPKNTGPPPVNTLQALEQMVMPSQNVMSAPGEYTPYRQASLAPLGPRMPVSPQHHQQWSPHGMGGGMQQQSPALSQQQQQQHNIYAQQQALSHAQQLSPTPQQPPQQHTVPQQQPQPTSQPVVVQQQQQINEQLQHSINDIVGHTNVPPQQLPQPQQHMMPQPTIQHVSPNLSQQMSSLEHSPINETSLKTSPVPMPLHQQQPQQQLQPQPNILDSFTNVLDTSHLKAMSETNSNDSSNSHLVANNDTNSNSNNSNSTSNSIVNNQPSSLHDSNSQNSIILHPSSKVASPSIATTAMLHDTNSQSSSSNGGGGGGIADFELQQPQQVLEQENHSVPSDQEQMLTSKDDLQPIEEYQSEPQAVSENSQDAEEAMLQQTEPPTLPPTEPEAVENNESDNKIELDESVEVAPVEEEPISVQPVETNIPQTVEDIPPTIVEAIPPQLPTAIPPLPNLIGIQPTMPMPPMLGLPMAGVIPPSAVVPGYPVLPLGYPTAAPGYVPAAFPPGPISHHQERAALQQQLQELYCMPASAEQQEKIMRLQERLSMLQQHEATEQCNGGPQCILQSPLYNNTQMVESPQVSSTTGRGRGKGSAKPRKPRAKKGDKGQVQVSGELGEVTPIPPTTNLPVSEDCVTQGAGDTSVSMMEFSESCDMSQEMSSNELDTSTDGKKKKPRKPRTPKDPNKSPKEKVPKEKKKKEPKDPNDADKPKRKRGRKPKDSADGDVESSGENCPDDSKPETTTTAMDEDVPDYDDIPVSKIPIKAADDSKDELDDKEDEEDSIMADSATPSGGKKKKKGAKSDGASGSSRRKPAGSLLSASKSSKKRKHRGRIVPESDGEADDMITTPPPSPPPDAELDSSKRRSARNTQRKKYTDDVMMRFSDDESGVVSTSPAKKEKKASSVAPSSNVNSDSEKGESSSVAAPENVETPVVEEVIEETLPQEKEKPIDISKPNYVYVNTGDEDSMVVQFVLAQRMGKRELLPDPPKEKPKPKIEEASSKPEDVEKKKDEGEEEEDKPDKTDEEDEEKVIKPESDEKEETAKVDEKEEEDEKKVADEDKDDEENSTKDEDTKVGNDDEEMEVDSTETETESEAVKEETTTVTTESEETKKEETEDKPKPEPVYIDVEEFYVKYRNFSYLHCEWRTEEELFKGDRRVFAKIRRFQQKQQQQMNIFENIEEEPFNPDFIEVDRILDMSEHTDGPTGDTTKHYLVKWKSLPYEDCTWELEEDCDEEKIEQFVRFTKLPPKSEWKSKKRPSPEGWKKLDKTPIYKNNNSLRPYQLEGLNWLKFSWYNTHNCILADEMGLGKTIQSLTFVHSVYEYGIRGPFLVIAPLSTIPNWQREFEGWTDMNIIVYHGSVTSKQMINDYEFYYKTNSGKVIKDLTKFNVLITTFEMIVTDYQDLRNFNWRLCVIDEAHRLKNRNCKLLEGLRQLNLEHRVLLSGTPLQNNISELFSLLNFLEPSQFACADTFMREFGSLRTEEEVQKLQALLKPMMLRRLKDDVEKSLAPKEETIIEVELTNIQKKYYRGILEQNFSFLKKGTTSANIPNLMNTMMELRKCCIHPYLLNGAEEQIQYDYKLQHGEDYDSYYKNLIQSAGKMVLIDKLLPKLKANGHRVLIFSQMVRCLDILEDYLMYKKYPFERIDGRIRGNLRQAAIDRYSKPDSDRFVFLLCTKAGGLGINLTAADTVIIYDSDWNPQNDLQAQARCHRIGQQKMVKIYRLLCRNTYEREMFDKASLKLGLDKAILQSMNTTQGGKDCSNRQLTKKEIEDLLKKGAYGAVMDDDAGDKFCEEDIDSILKRRTQVITMESEKGSTFSKASFAASGNRSDITIDDPDFWNKWAKRADIDPDAAERDETEDLVLSEPRRRTQIKRYGHEDVMDMSEDSSNENSDDDTIGSRSRRRKEKLAKRNNKNNDDYIPRDRDTLAALGLEEIRYGNWAKSECFKVEKGLLSFGWGRWTDILELGQFKRGWRETDVEECARVILLYCLQVYKGDEKIKNFIWDLITPTEDGEVQKISRDHSGLHNLVPRGRNAKGRNGGKSMKEGMTGISGGHSKSQDREKIPGAQDILDPNHWSKEEKFDADAFLEVPYKKHLGRHANKVLLRVRMLYYIQHEVIGDLVQQIKDGVYASELPIRPPPTPDQTPCSWWNPNCCDKSLLVGTYKHGCEMYRQIRADLTLCFHTHIGPGDDSILINNSIIEDDANSKHEDAEDGEDDGTATKDSDSRQAETKEGEGDRPSSSGLDEEESGAGSYPPTNMAPDDSTIWPSMQDLNTRLRRVITAYQRNYKKEELKQQQKAKLQALVSSPSVSNASTSGMGGHAMQVMSGGNGQNPQMVGMSSINSANNTIGSGSSGSTGPMASTSAGGGGMSSLGHSNSNSNVVQGNNNGNNNNSSSQSQQQQSSQMPTAADISLMLSLLNPLDPSQLSNMDLNKFVMCLKMERQGKMEQVAKERERQRLECIPKKWNRREEYEFLRVLTGYGIDLQQSSNIVAPDWMKFKAMAHLERKSDETLSDYYKVFIAMCKRQAGVKLSEGEKGLEGIIEDISEDHARLVLDRLELLSKLREVARNPNLDEKLRQCENNVDTPDWWESGRHDKEIIAGVLKHGLYRSETFIFNDPNFSFSESERRFIRELEAQTQRSIKIESNLKTEMEEVALVKEEIKEDPLKMEMHEDEIVEKKIESVDDDLTTFEKDPLDTESETKPEEAVTDTQEDVSEKEDEAKEETKDEEEDVLNKSNSSDLDEGMVIDETIRSTGDSDEEAVLNKSISSENNEPDAVEDDKSHAEEGSGHEEKKSEDVDKEKKENASDNEKKESIEDKEDDVASVKEVKSEEKQIETITLEEDDEDRPSEPRGPAETLPSEEKVKKEEEVLDLASSGDPDDDEVMKEKEKAVEEECKKQAAELKARFPDLEVIQPSTKVKSEKDKPKLEMTMVRWYKDFALEQRIAHIVHCVEKNKWPVSKTFSAYTGCQGIDLDVPLHETITHMNFLDRRSETPDVITITTDQGMPKHLQAQLQAANTSASPISAMAAAAAAAVAAGASSTSGSGKKRKRHIAIDVETERAKLHALLNSTQVSISGQKGWGEDDGSDSSRRSTPSLSLQPPPAHQHQPMRQSTPQFNKPAGMPMKTPPPPSMGAPMDLSSSLPKMSMSDMLKSPIDLSEVQDFSMASKKSSGLGGFGGKSKLDDTLSKLMKKNNCTIEEPVVGKEKKRKKLDEIVLGLSAAKEQKTFPDPSLPSTKKQQITPSVSVTPANLPSSSASNQNNQKPFTITVTSVPGKSSKGSSSSASMQAQSASGLAALQNMAMAGLSSKDSLSAALLAQSMQIDPQTLMKQQKLIQSMPASQRKAFEGFLADFTKLNSTHDTKVNKWLTEQSTAAFNEQMNMDYRRQSRQQQQQHGSGGGGGNSGSSSSMASSMPKASPQPPPPQSHPLGPQGLTGDEPVPVIHKQTGKRLTGSKAPQLKKLMQWLPENPAYEIDPKWLELMQNPMSAPSPKQQSHMDMGGSSSSKNHGGRPSSTSSNASSGGMSSQQQQQQQQQQAAQQQQQQSKKARQNAMDQANQMQFASLAGMNPNLLAGLPGLGAFDAKNPLLMPFGGMSGLAGMSGLGNLGNLNNMNLFASLAGLGGLGNLAGMDSQSLAALMSAAGTGLGGSMGGGTPQQNTPSKSGGSQSSNKKKMSDSSQQGGGNQGGGQSAKVPTSSASSSSNAANNPAFPFLFPNPSLLYPPLGLGSLNPYSLGSGMSTYDQLTQQYNLINGVSATATSTSNSKSHQSQSKSSSRSSSMSSANMGASTSTSSSGGRGRNSASSRQAAAAAANEMAQLSNLLMPTADPHLLEQLSRMAGMDINQASRLMSGLTQQQPQQSQQDKRSAAAAASAMAAKEAQEKQAAKEQQKWMESLARGALPQDLAAMQAFTQGKMPTSSSSKSSKNSAQQQMPQLPLPSDLSQAFFAEMAAQAMAAAAAGSGGGGGGGGKRSRDQEVKDAFEQFSKHQMDLYSRTLGLGSAISLIPTSSASAVEDHKPKRSRSDSHTSNSSSKDEMSAAMALNLGGMSSIEKSLRGVGPGGNAGGGGGGQDPMDKVTLTPLSSAGIAANLPSQTTITIAPPISSGASSSSERSERSDSRISLTITNAADAAKLPPPYEEADELIIQPILKKLPNEGSSPSVGDNDDDRRSSGRHKRPRSSAGSADLSMDGGPPEKRRELRSTRHTRQSGGGGSDTLNLSASSENDERGD